jgi:hypothetical protein
MAAVVKVAGDEVAENEVGEGFCEVGEGVYEAGEGVYVEEVGVFEEEGVSFSFSKDSFQHCLLALQIQ